MKNNYPLVKFHFTVEWGGSGIGFSRVSGLTAEQAVIEYRDGASPEFSTVKVPGLRKFSNIILERGAHQGDNEFFLWLNTVGITAERRDITIHLLNESHEPSISWRIRNAWPVAVRYDALNALKSEVFIERLELAHEGLMILNS